MIHAVVILLVMLLAAPLAGYLAMPALAALLLMTAWTMSEPHKWGSYWRSPNEERFLLLLTLMWLQVYLQLLSEGGIPR